MPVESPIIDCHCHAGKGDGFTGPWDTDAPLGRYRRRADAAGIDATVVFAAFGSDYAVANEEVARIVRADPRRLLGFAMVHPDRDAGRVGRMVTAAVRDHGFRGVKVHRHDARLTREVCEIADRLRLPVIYDVMGDVASVELFAAQYPRVAFVIPHLGSFADSWSAQRAFLDILARHPNVYTDTSGVRRFDLLVEAVARAGADKVLFGSDGPWLHPGVELAKVRALGLAREDEALVLGANLVRLLRRVRRPRRLPAPIRPPLRSARRPAVAPPAPMRAAMLAGSSPTGSMELSRAADPWQIEAS